MRDRRAFKTVAIGTGATVTQQSQGFIVPAALLWLWVTVPDNYRWLVRQLWGSAPEPPKRHHHTTANSPHARQRQPTLPALAALTAAFLSLARAVSDELLLLSRAAYLAALFLPALLTAPLISLLPSGRERWLSLLQWALENAGPAFIKWGQWASTRPDLFPADVCDRLERLQTSAPAHAAPLTVAAVERAFGCPVSHLFAEFDLQPVASGSIAQIHRATLSAKGAAAVGLPPGTQVAVKVRHPGVTHLMHRDFILMQRAAAAASALPGLRELRLEESIRQFGGPLKEQLDLSVEAQHLSRFNANFAAWGNVCFPVPLYPLVAPEVLVESFEEGDLISRYVRGQSAHNAVLAKTGVNVFLNMMLRDNFIHADLHPGNIIVKSAAPPSALQRAAGPWLPRRLRAWLMERCPQIVLLDTGMIVELSDADRDSLLGFFRCLTRLDGRGVAEEILNMSVEGHCKDPERFHAELDAMFGRMDREQLRLQSQTVIRSVIDVMRQHGVTLRPSVSTVVVTSLVLEGWSSQLDPEIRILDAMRDMLGTDWGERLAGSVERLMAAGQVMELATV